MSRFLVLAIVALLAGCGFQPVHGGADGGRGAKLAQIAVDPIAERVGYDMREALISALGGGRTPASPAYTLTVVPLETESGLAIDQDDSVTRYNLILQADYTLFDAATRQAVTSGSVRSFAAYNVDANEFATLTARRDVSRRAAREVASLIRSRLFAALP